MISASFRLAKCVVGAGGLSLGVSLCVSAADVGAIKATNPAAIKASTTCAACHGTNGISVAEHIPNLAAQNKTYLASQLLAFKNNGRKSQIMNAIAASLNEREISDLATYFAEQPTAIAKSKSAFLPSLANTRLNFPAGYKAEFIRYHVENFSDDKQVKHYYANGVARSAATAGLPLPDGSIVIVEIYSAKLDDDQKPVTDRDGLFVPSKLLSYATMGRETGWGDGIPQELKNEQWNYAIFSPDRTLRRGINQAECLACHLPASKSSYLFTYKHLSAAR